MREFLETIGHDVCKETLAILAEVIPCGLCIVDEQGRFIAVNQQLCRDLRYTPAQLMKKTFQEITHPDDLRDDLEAFNRLKNGKDESYAMPKRYLVNGNGTFQAYLIAAPVRIEGKLQFFISQVLPSEKPTATDAPQLNAVQRLARMCRAEWLVIGGLIAIGASLDTEKVVRLLTALK